MLTKKRTQITNDTSKKKSFTQCSWCFSDPLPTSPFRVKCQLWECHHHLVGPLRTVSGQESIPDQSGRLLASTPVMAPASRTQAQPLARASLIHPKFTSTTPDRRRLPRPPVHGHESRCRSVFRGDSSFFGLRCLALVHHPKNCSPTSPSTGHTLGKEDLVGTRLPGTNMKVDGAPKE